MTVTPPPYLFTSQTEIERLWSAEGAGLLADDDEDGNAEPNVWNDIIYEATDTVTMYVQRRYTDGSALSLSSWVRRAATVLGAYYLSQRRANPERFESAYQRIMNLLEEIWAGKLRIPRLAMSSQQTPALSNYVVDDRYPNNNIRVKSQQSVGTPTADQATDTLFLPDMPR